MLNDREFCENRRGETHTLRNGVNDFNPYFLHLLAHLGEIRLKRAAHTAVELVWVCENRSRKTFLMGVTEAMLTPVQ